MRAFTYERPTSIADAVELLGASTSEAVRLLAGGTDLIIRMRDGSLAPTTVVDIKRIPELRPDIRADGGDLVISATTTMTRIAADPRIRRDFAGLAEAAAVVGSVQIRNRATLGGNLCNASPAADTAPPLLAHRAEVHLSGPAGTRRVPLDDLFVRSGVTTLAPGELLTAVRLPIPTGRTGSVQLRRTRRRGHDLASVTLACVVDESGTTRVAYGSLGPRPIVAVDESGILADPSADPATRAEILGRMFAAASPSPTSMRSGPEYRLAMLRVLGDRGVRLAVERLGAS